MTSPIVATPSGRVRGTSVDGVDAFLGIPYAEPPVGELRWQPTRPHPGWDDVLDATAYGPFAPQLAGSMYDPIVGHPHPFETSEDCLTLNVWRPENASGPLPVLVWIHGGGFMMGSGNMIEYAGDRFARNGDLVVVSINYRLGPFGYLHGMNGTSNLWLNDQAVAIRWIHDNIAAFGGDPASVTLAGQSAGALSIGALAQHPLSTGLFHRAILQSGPFGLDLLTPEEGQERTQALAEILGHSSPEELKDETTENLLNGMIGVLIKYAVPGKWGLAFLPVLDPDTLPIHPLQAIEESDVELLVGWAEDEGTFAFALDPRARNATEAEVTQWIGLDHDDPAAEYGRLLAEKPTRRPFEIISALVTEELYVRDSKEIVALRASERPAFAYEFRTKSRACGGDLGTTHCFDLPFSFHAADRWPVPSMLDDADPEVVERVSTAMHAAWIGFAKTGDPATTALPWGRCSANDPQLAVFDDDAHLEQAPLARWAGVEADG